MARPLRVEYEGALYHITAHSMPSEDLFLDERDRQRFLSFLADAIEVHNLICHAYCLMSNHFHLLIETPDANLSTAMRDVNGQYAQWHNVRHSRSGHLFDGRHKAFVIEKETYLLAVARYIVLNAVRAGLVAVPEDWKWSSYGATAGLTRVPGWLSVDWLLSQFSDERKKAQWHYRQFVAAGMDGTDPYKDLKNGFLLGSDQFVHEIWEKTNGTEILKDYPRSQRIVGRPTLEDIFSSVQSKKERNDAIVFARMRCGYLAAEIARYIKLDSAFVGRISRGTHSGKKSEIGPDPKRKS